MCNSRWLFLSYNLVFRRTFTSTSGCHFLLNFPCQRSSLSVKLSFVSDRWSEKLDNFCDSSSNPFDVFCCLFWRDKGGVPNPMIAVEVFIQQGELLDFNFRELLVYLEFMLCSRSAMVYFYLPCCWASRKPITSVEFKFVARHVEASVVIRAAKPKFVAESRTWVYFAQHVASTGNTVYCCETSWSQTW